MLFDMQITCMNCQLHVALPLLSNCVIVPLLLSQVARWGVAVVWCGHLFSDLLGTTVDDSGLKVVLDLATAGSS